MYIPQVLLEKARAKGQQDNTFTESVLQRLFCNIEDILDLHRRLLEGLKACVKGGVSYNTSIAGVYLKFVSVSATHPYRSPWLCMHPCKALVTKNASLQVSVCLPVFPERRVPHLPGLWQGERRSSETSLRTGGQRRLSCILSGGCPAHVCLARVCGWCTVQLALGPV